MKGIEALVLLKQGYKITCKFWKNEDWYLYYSDYSGYAFSIQSEEFPRVPNLNPVTPWTNLHNQEVIEEFLHSIFEYEWEIVK
jgi:hypothetical protein